MLTPPRMYQEILNNSVLNSLTSWSSLTNFASISAKGTLIRLVRKNYFDLNQLVNYARVRSCHI